MRVKIGVERRAKRLEGSLRLRAKTAANRLATALGCTENGHSEQYKLLDKELAPVYDLD